MAGNARPNRKLKNRLGLTFEEITKCLERGEMQIHKHPLGFVITEIKQLPDERILHVVWLGGERINEWIAKGVDDLRKFGAEHGCNAIEAHCRPGFVSILRAQGCRTIKIIMRADL